MPSSHSFGEQLPLRFFKCAASDFPQATLLLVMGTSLAVHPFAALVGEVRHSVPRLLINREKVGQQLGLDFEGGTDGFEGGDCDEAVRKLCSLLDWTPALDAELAARPTPAAS